MIVNSNPEERCRGFIFPENGIAGHHLSPVWAMILVCMVCPPALGDMNPGEAASEAQETQRRYRTREERRDNRVEYEVTEWLTAAGLLELEGRRESFSGSALSETVEEAELVLDLNLTASFFDDVLKAEVELEYDSATMDLVADEAAVALEQGNYELSAGKQYLDFGEYFSRFVTGPLLEFGETRASAITLTYDRNDRLEVSGSVYQGENRDQGSDGLDGALALQGWINERWAFGLSAISDIADAAELLSEDNVFLQGEAGLSGYLLWTSGDFEASFEVLGATRAFEGKDGERVQPFAWNLEFAHYPSSELEWALRVEGSRELEDAPELRYGVAATIHALPRASLTLELLRGEFNSGALGEDHSFDHSTQIGALLSVVF